MSILIQKQIGDCENIRCTNKLGHFAIKNKSRFCRRCRGSEKVLEWKCRGCDGIISSARCRETRYYCNNCRGIRET